jgi:eukaryotic-like serine/threonine-protein kinase
MRRQQRSKYQRSHGACRRSTISATALAFPGTSPYALAEKARSVPDSPSKTIDFPPGIQAGDVIANRYRLDEVVGRGGMGVVVAARHLELDERVAVKFMSPDALSDTEAIARFDREVKAAARIKSEYVARVYDAGKLGDGRRFMVLEYLEGEDLSARVQRDGPLEPEQAIRFLLQACSALLEAHGLGIIHRDLKPANLRVVRRTDGSEIVKVLDFGIMKRMPGSRTETDAHETQPGTIVGTPYYTSPEQLRGSTHVDARSDVWSMGATLFELLTGSPPFGGKTYPQIIANVLEATPNSLRALRPGLSEDLENIAMKCLEKQPEARYGSLIELAKDLADTIELDAELKALLERMLRQQQSSPINTPVGQLLSAGTPNATSTPAFAVVAEQRHPRPADSIRRPSTNAYQLPDNTRRRLLLTGSATLVTAILVIALGMPWLPQFKGTVSAAAPTASESPALETRALTEPLEPPQAPKSAPPSTFEQTPTSAVNEKTPPRRNPRSGIVGSPSASTRISVPPTSASANTPPTTPRPRNPLLVRPR